MMSSADRVPFLKCRMNLRNGNRPLLCESIAKARYRQIEMLVSAVNDEMRENGAEIVVGIIKNSN